VETALQLRGTSKVVLLQPTSGSQHEMNNLAVDPCYTLDAQTIVEEWRNGQPEVYEDHRGYDYRPPWARMTEEDAERYGIERPQNHDVSFHYNAKVEQHHFGKTHPMKPWRLTLTKQLVFGYGLQWAMDCYQARSATKEELAIFHDRGYLDFLQRFALRVNVRATND